MITRQDFVAAVRSCVGTPTRHMGRCIGAGLDCVGVPIAALAVCGITVTTDVYANPPGAGALREALVRHCFEVDPDDCAAGDLLVAIWKGEPRHLMVCVDRHDDRIVAVHARGGSGQVVCESIGRAHRVASVWRLREVG